MSRLPFKPRAGARAAARPVIPKPAADEFAEEAEPSAPPPAGAVDEEELDEFGVPIAAAAHPPPPARASQEHTAGGTPHTASGGPSSDVPPPPPPLTVPNQPPTAIVASASGAITHASQSALTKHGIRQYVESLHGVRIFLQNCVSTVNLGVNPDLAKIATHARNAEYNPRRFSAAVIRLRDPKATALLFTSGKMVVTGAKSEEESRNAARIVAKIVRKLGYPVTFKDFRIQNLVGTGSVGFPIRLEGLADEHGRCSSYEPELFPGLVYRMEKPKVVFLVFVSGKVVITGSKTRQDMQDAFDTMYPVLRQFRKAPVA